MSGGTRDVILRFSFERLRVVTLIVFFEIRPCDPLMTCLSTTIEYSTVPFHLLHEIKQHNRRLVCVMRYTRLS